VGEDAGCTKLVEGQRAGVSSSFGHGTQVLHLEVYLGQLEHCVVNSIALWRHSVDPTDLV
jgi:hypothetical protein